MTLVLIRDQTKQGLERLVTEWEDKPNVQGLVKSYLQNIEKVEKIYEQLLNERGVFTAIGAQLDVIGTIVGQKRGGNADPEYRQDILNRIAINAADGTPEKIIEILKTITGSAKAQVFEHYPANVHAFISGAPSNSVAEALQDITPAGVSSRLMFDAGVDSYIGATAVRIVIDLALENNDEVGLENGDTLGISDVTITAFGNGTRSFFPHSLETVIKNPLCGLFKAPSAAA
jgi:hypothetical protein